MNKCYIASGWFSPEWLEELEGIKTCLDNLGLAYFSPKDENLCTPDSDLDFQDQVFEGNIRGLAECDWMICNTRNKDMGSIFEAGYFHSLEKPIVYFCAGLPSGAQFNLMLAASGIGVCTSLEQLHSYLGDCNGSGELLSLRYEGKIE
ncbi:MAG TPA: hypothetical protein EYQ86_05685 [Bacteroidetes bacterium]|nr:hypothetical protein [Bacteroidota bacterium]